MLADAEQTTDTEAALAAQEADALRSLADSFGDEDAVHSADGQSAAWRAAGAAAAAYVPGKYSRTRHDADMASLKMLARRVRSEPLRRLIDEAIPLKIEADRLASEQNRAQVFAFEVEKAGGSEQEISAAKGSEQRREAEYMAALEALEAGAREVADAPFATVDDALDRAQAYAHLIGTASNALPECDEDVIAMGDSYRAALQKLSGSASDRATWDLAFARWQSALATLRPAQAEDDARLEAINRQAPAELLERRRHQDFSSSWLCGTYVTGDVLLTASERARLLPIVEEWQKTRSRLLDEAEELFDDQTWSAMHDEVDNANAALMATQPPGLAELVVLQRLGACRMSEQDDDTTGGFDDLGWVAFTDEGYWNVSHVCETHRHTLRLAGIDHPILHMERFSPRKWIEAYEAAGQSVSIGHRGMILTVPDEEAKSHPTAVMRAELALTPWKYWAVQLSANQRQDQGGDPFYDSHGYSGPQDQRGNRGRKPITVLLADLIEFSADPGGGSPIPHVTRIDNRGKA